MNTTSHRLVFIASIFIALIVGFFVIRQYMEPRTEEQIPHADSLQYSSTIYGLSFSYPSIYVLSEGDAPGSGMREHHWIMLVREEDLPLPEGGEGPPAITIDMYQNNLDKQTTEQWIRNSSASNFKLGDGTLSTTTISDLPAISYRWSGLYEGTTIATAQPKWIYTFTVTYLEIGAPIVQDFVVIRDSVRIVK